MIEHVHLPPTIERVVEVTSEQLETVQRALRKPGWSDYDKAKDALRSIGIEPQDNVTYRFVVKN